MSNLFFWKKSGSDLKPSLPPASQANLKSSSSKPAISTPSNQTVKSPEVPKQHRGRESETTIGGRDLFEPTRSRISLSERSRIAGSQNQPFRQYSLDSTQFVIVVYGVMAFMSILIIIALIRCEKVTIGFEYDGDWLDYHRYYYF